MLQKAVRYKILHLKSINKNLRSMLLPCKGPKEHRKDSKDFSLASYPLPTPCQVFLPTTPFTIEIHHNASKM